MHISFKSQDTTISNSSSNLIEYLDKENQINNVSENEFGYETFFDSKFNSDSNDLEIKKNDIITALDNNRGRRNLDESNFFLLNVSPSKAEIYHMEKIAVAELEKRGLFENNNEASKILFKEQKDELIKIQMKFYTKDLMNEYAKNFEREIYINEDKLPNDSQKKALNELTEKVFNEYLKENNIILNDKNDSKSKESKEWVSVNNLKIIEEKEKSVLIEIDLKEKGKGNVFVPISALHKQENGKFKLPKNLYDAKEKEVLLKNTLKEIDYKYMSTSKPYKTKEDIVLNFQKEDNRFSEPLSFSINEKDIIQKGDKYFVSEHLLNEKENYSLLKGIEKDYGKDKEKIYNSIAESKGFDLSKRPLTGDDLLWFAKIETTRKYDRTDKLVVENNLILKKIKELKGKNGSKKEIEKQEQNLHREKESGKIIVAGLQKEGYQYHSHVVVSRHDKTMHNPRNKISLSPLANAKESQMKNGSKVGFDRSQFFKKGEELFDKKFEYKRPEYNSYEKYNQEKNHKNKGVENALQNEGKSFLMRHTGLNVIKKEMGMTNPIVNHISKQSFDKLKQDLGMKEKITDPQKIEDLKNKNVSNLGHSIVQSIKQQVGIADIPTRLPTSVTQLAIKGIKKILSKAIEY